MEAILSVTQFVTAVNVALGMLQQVVVEGEVDEFKIIQNKWVTFVLKDGESSVNCFMTVWQFRGQIENGMLVKAIGEPKIRNKGFFSFVVQNVMPSGEGSLKRAFELLKVKLEMEGIFALERKRTLPRFPQHIALLTSRDAAAYSDFLKVLEGRLGGLTISFIHTGVQGDDAPRQIVAALEMANTELPDLDVVVLVRGGGSLEDLAAFNDETVVRAVAASRTPTIVGIGHERDVSLAELAADMRASTPSNAAELVVQTRQELIADVSHKELLLRGAIQNVLATVEQNIQRAAQRLGDALKLEIERRADTVQQLQRVLVSLSPQATLKRGYSITRTTKGELVRQSKQVKAGTALKTTLHEGEVASIVTTP